MMIRESSHNKNIQIINFSSLLAAAVISDNAEYRHNDESYLQYGNVNNSNTSLIVASLATSHQR